ncbi:hypothetical protein H0H81_004273 [Sphagnurus paluster]|uniref:Uncharacterized protein n=1 Tax=Sphagnurus paluster TaxID=117069 RepID=A0A9P7FYQ7_9AGAR|nr:hypothetical protein H0H81_004273 [Sphagnurus paluster]
MQASRTTRSAGPLPFGEIFNLTELRNTLRKPVLEWSEVKILAPRLSLSKPSDLEQVGCWSTRSPREKEPITSQNLLDHLGLDVSYTRVPASTQCNSALVDNGHLALTPLADKIYPWNPDPSKPDEYEFMTASHSGARLAPDHRLSCFDLMYYASLGSRPYEWNTRWSPAWRFVGKYLKFTDSVMDLAKQYVRRALDAQDELPQFISVHARRGDFVHQCYDVPSHCLAPLSAYAHRVKEVQDVLLEKLAVNVTEVLITSDETDPKFWSDVKDIGWKRIDHEAERTLDQHGEWYLPIIDMVALSLGLGFVGSEDSTVSIVSAHRVVDWNHGATRVVGWGGRH